MSRTVKLSRRDREIAETVNAAAFVNPFCDEQERLDGELCRVVSSFAPSSQKGRWSDGMAAWLDQSPKEQRNLNTLSAEDRPRMRVVFLFVTYHHFLQELDEIIVRQGTQDAPVKIPCAKACLQMLSDFGFEEGEAVRLFGIFFQLRRAHYFIVRGLKGESASMKEFRRRLWNNVFTDDIRWYDQHLWNRMEDFSTLLLGETGSGKGTAAAAIGRSGYIPYVPSQNSFAANFNRAFISINLAQFPETLLEAELFGYRKGAFTGAVESHEGVFARCSQYGAIFLDEIGEVGSPVQVKLLNVLQERTFSPVGSRQSERFGGRVVAATNKSLCDLHSRKVFRDDFFYRISSDIIEVPTLRQRLGESSRELDQLLETILTRLTGDASLLETIRERLNKSPGPDYAWPGNVRELEQAVRRILVAGSYAPQTRATESTDDLFVKRFHDLDFTADELLQNYCRRAYKKLGTRAAVARQLQLDPRTVLKYLNSGAAGLG